MADQVNPRGRFLDNLKELYAMSNQTQLALESIRLKLPDGAKEKQQLLAVQLRVDDMLLLLCDLLRDGGELLVNDVNIEDAPAKRLH